MMPTLERLGDVDVDVLGQADGMNGAGKSWREDGVKTPASLWVASLSCPEMEWDPSQMESLQAGKLASWEAPVCGAVTSIGLPPIPSSLLPPQPATRNPALTQGRFPRPNSPSKLRPSLPKLPITKHDHLFTGLKRQN